MLINSSNCIVLESKLARSLAAKTRSQCVALMTWVLHIDLAISQLRTRPLGSASLSSATLSSIAPGVSALHNPRRVTA